MSIDLSAFHAYAQGELDVYPGDWFGDAALVAEEVGRLREALEQIADSKYRGYHEVNSVTLGNARAIARAALAQDTVER